MMGDTAAPRSEPDLAVSIEDADLIAEVNTRSTLGTPFGWPSWVNDVLAILLIVAVTAVVIVSPPPDQAAESVTPLVISLVVAIPLILLRRRHPLTCLAMAVIGTIGLALWSNHPVPLIIVVAGLLYSAAMILERRVILICGGILVVVLPMVVGIVDGGRNRRGWCRPRGAGHCHVDAPRHRSR